MSKISSKITISLILLMVSSLNFNYAKAGKCPFTICGTASLGDGVCARLSPSTDHTGDTISLTKCIKGKSCSYSFQTYLELKSLAEETTLSCAETKNVKYGGEDCSSDSDCSSVTIIDGESKNPAKCVDLKCQTIALNSSCNDDGASCPIGATCGVNSKKCERLFEEGSQCELSYECGFNLLCNDKKCTSLFSLDNGTAIATDDDANKGLLCKSGYAYENKCAKMTYKDSTKINKDGVVECELDSECEYNINYSEDKVEAIIKQACICGESAKSFCPIPYNNEDSKYYQNYLTSLKAYHSDILSKTNKYNIKNKFTVYDESVNEIKALFSDYTATDCALEVMNVINLNKVSTYEIKSLSSNINLTFDVKKREAYILKYTNLLELINNNKITLLLSEFYENVVIGVSYKPITIDNLPEFSFESGKSKIFQFEALIHQLFTETDEDNGLYFYVYLKEESDKDLVAITLSISNTVDDLYMMGYHLYYNGNAFDNFFTMNLTLKKKQSAIFLFDYKNISYEEGTTFFVGDLYNTNSNIKISYLAKNTVSIYSKDATEDSIKSYFYPSGAEYTSIDVNSEVDLLTVLKNNNNKPILIKVENNEDVNYEYSTHSTFFIQPIKSNKTLQIEPIDKIINSFYILKFTATNQTTNLVLNNSSTEFGTYIRNISTDSKLKFSINSHSNEISPKGKFFYDSDIQETAQQTNSIELSSIDELKENKAIFAFVNVYSKTKKYREITNIRTEVDYDSDYQYYIALNTKGDLNRQENIIEIISDSSSFTNANYEIVLYNTNEFMNKVPSELESNIKSYKLGSSSSLFYDISFLNNFEKTEYAYVIFTFKSNTKEKISTYAYNKTVQIIDTEASENYYVKLENSAYNFYQNTILVNTPSTYEKSDKFILTNIISHESMTPNTYYAIGSNSKYIHVASSQEHFISEDSDNKTPYEVKTGSEIVRKKIFVRVFGFVKDKIVDSNTNVYVSNSFVDSKDTITNTDFESYEKLVHITVPKSTLDNDFTAQIFIDDFSKDKEGNALPNKYHVNYKYKTDISDAKYDTSSLYNYLNKGYDSSSITFEDNSSAYELSPLSNGIYDFVIVGENTKTKILGFYTPALNKYFAQSLILDDYNTIKIEKSLSNIYYFQFSQTSNSLFYLYFGNLNQNLVTSKKFDLIKHNLNGDVTTTALFSEENDFDTRQKFEIETLKEGEEATSYIIKVTLAFKPEDPEKEIDEDEDQDEGIKSFDIILNNFASDSTEQILTINELDHQTVTIKSSTIFKQVKLLSNMQIYKLYIKSDEKYLINTVEYKSDKTQKTVSKEFIYPEDPETKEISLSFLSEDINVDIDEKSGTYSSSILLNLSEDSIKEVSDVNNIKNLYVYLLDSKPAKKICPVYFCDSLDKDRCFERKPLQYETKEAFAYDLYKCQTSENPFCPVNPENLESSQDDVFCTKEKVYTSYIGSYCFSDMFCSGDKCINSICTSNSEIKTCKDHSSCKAGDYCDSDSKECKAQKDKDSDCKVTEECKNNSVCSKNKCVEFYSIENNSETINLGTIVNKFCKSGFAVNNKCTELYLKSEMDKGCTLDSDCIYTNSAGENITVENSCECGFNEDNNQYCLAGNTKEYSEYISKIKEKYTNPHCHTLERDNCISNNYNPELENTINDLEKETIYKNKLIDASSCVEDFFFAPKYSPKPDPFYNECPFINCQDKSQDNNVCVAKNEVLLISSIILNECKNSNQHCEYDYTKFTSEGKYESYCVNDIELRYSGEPCSIDSDCSINDSKCVNNACSELNFDDCADSTYCNTGEFCDLKDTKTCVPQRKLGDKCTEAYDCLNSLVCYNNKCIEPFTLDIGANIEKQDEFSKKYLCSTNYSSNNICAALKYDKYSFIEKNGTVACNTQSKCNYLIQNSKDGEWKPYDEKCNCSLNPNENKEAYCPYSTSDDLTVERNKKIIELKKSLLDNNRHTLHRENGNVNETRDNLSLKCIEFNSNSYYRNMDTCTISTLGFKNCVDISEDRGDLTTLKNNEIFSFKNNLDKELNIVIGNNSKFYLNSPSNKSAISKIEIKSYNNFNVLKEVDGKSIKHIYESDVLIFENDDKMIISIVFNEEIKEEVEFYLYIEDYSENSNYINYRYSDSLEINDGALTLGNITNFDSSKPAQFIVDLRNYKYPIYDSQIENSVQKLYEVSKVKSGTNLIQSAIIFNSHIKSAKAVVIDDIKSISSIRKVNFEDYFTVYKSDENNVMDITLNNPNSILFVEVTFNTEVNDFSSEFKIIKPLIKDYCNNSVKELSVKMDTNKKANFQVIQLCSDYDFLYNSLKIYSNSKNVKVSLGYGKINTNSLVSKKADYDLNSNPIQTVALDKEQFSTSPTYISVYYDGDSEYEIYFSLSISDDKLISFSDPGLSYYYNINSDEKVYLLYYNNDEIKNSFIFKSIINKATIKKAAFSQIGLYQTLYDLKNKPIFDTPIESQIYNDESKKIGYELFVLSVAEANQIVSGKFMVISTDSTTPSNTDVRMLADEKLEFNKDILIIASKTQPKTILFNQEEEVYKFDISLLNGESAEIYLNDETTKYKELNKSDSTVSIIQKNLFTITFKINSEENIDSYILVSSATKLDTTDKLVTKNQENIVSSSSKENYSTLIFKISEKTQYNYINLKSIEGILGAIEKTIIPINDEGTIYYTETDSISSPEELTDPSEYNLYIENPTDKSFYVVLRILSQSTSTTKDINSFRANYSSDVLLSLESGKISESLSFTKSQKTTKKFEIPSTKSKYLSFNVARSTLSSQVSCSVIINNKDPENYSSFKANNLLSKIAYENKKDGKSSILLVCDNISTNDLNIYVIGSNVPKEYSTSLTYTDYSIEINEGSDYKELEYDLKEKYLPSSVASSAKVEYYAAVKEKTSDEDISYYNYIVNKDKYTILNDFKLDFDSHKIKENVKYVSSIVAIETTYNVPVLYDTISFTYNGEDPTSSTTSSSTTSSASGSSTTSSTKSSSSTSSSSEHKDKSGMPWWGVILILLAVTSVIALVLLGLKYFMNMRRMNSEDNTRTLINDENRASINNDI